MDDFAKKAKYSILNNLEPSSAINTKKYTKVIYEKASLAINEIAREIKSFLNE